MNVPAPRSADYLHKHIENAPTMVTTLLFARLGTMFVLIHVHYVSQQKAHLIYECEYIMYYRQAKGVMAFLLGERRSSASTQKSSIISRCIMLFFCAFQHHITVTQFAISIHQPIYVLTLYNRIQSKVSIIKKKSIHTIPPPKPFYHSKTPAHPHVIGW